MKSNFKKLRDLIIPCNARNNGTSLSNLLGINIDKFFMPSVANIIGTDLSAYKIVKFNQFACNRMHVGRDKRLPVALSKYTNDFIVSPAYDVFEIRNDDEILPEYLMMWFSRKEFDRNAWFYTDADVRGGLSWDALCDMNLPVPSIEKQEEIVKEYNTVINRIELNNKLIQKLEETAQAIYKHWFVDFEFPDENGKPYKSSGGEMVDSDLDEIPKGWRVGKLYDLVDTQYGYTASADFNNLGIKFLRITDIAQKQIDWDSVPNCTISDNEVNKYMLKNGDVVIARTGATAGFAKRINKNHPKAIFASYLVRMISKIDIFNIYIGMTVDSKKYKEFIISNAEGSAQPQANANLMTEFPILKPLNIVILKLNNLIEPIIDQIENLQIQNTKLDKLINLLLSELATIKR